MRIYCGPGNMSHKWFAQPDPLSGIFLGPYDTEDEAQAVNMTPDQAINVLRQLLIWSKSSIGNNDNWQKRLEIWIRSRDTVV